MTLLLELFLPFKRKLHKKRTYILFKMKKKLKCDIVGIINAKYMIE